MFDLKYELTDTVTGSFVVFLKLTTVVWMIGKTLVPTDCGVGFCGGVTAVAVPAIPKVTVSVASANPIARIRDFVMFASFCVEVGLQQAAK
jgi:hypothetical protein